MTDRKERRPLSVGALVLMAAALLAAGAGPLGAQAPAQDTLSITLEEALARALEQSEEIGIARSRVQHASAQVVSTRSAALPQINANLGYTRTFASAFDTGGGFELPDSLRFSPDTTASLEERIRYLERRTPIAGLGGLGQLFGNLPFGRENAYAAQVSGSQILYSGGRVGAALEIARDFRAAAQYGLVEETAELRLQVQRAYYQALFARELERIAEAALEQAERFLEQERLRFRAGQASELDVLRAEVSQENLRPQLVQARNAAELASLNLKRLIDVPLDRPIGFATELRPPPEGAPQPPVNPALVTAQRAALLAAERQVAMREQQVRIARGAFLPSVVLQMSYGKQLFPGEPLDLGGDWRTDWSATLGVQVPVFQGFKRTADVSIAQQELAQARLQHAQLREAVQLQYEQARGERERARAAIAARQRTVEVAERVYRLTELRYQQGLATQLEVTDARLGLLQARTNLAQALSDFYVADAEMARAVIGEATAVPTATVPQAPPAPTVPPAAPVPGTADGR